MSPNAPCTCENCFFNEEFPGPPSWGPCLQPSPIKRLFTPFPKVHNHRGHAEQIGKYGGMGTRKFEKNRANRLRRRAEKADPANAPTKLIRGWND